LPPYPNDQYKHGVKTGKSSLKEICDKLDAIQATLGVAMVAMVLCEDDTFRKPRTGAWEFIEQSEELNGGMDRG
jgi:hypothetical protein